jgi:REP element-mobilizing transposase RayT
MLAGQRESQIEEGHLMPDHVHMLVSIPPKYSVSQVVGFIKGKSAIHLARSTVSASAILWGSTSGLGGTSSLRWAVTSR